MRPVLFSQLVARVLARSRQHSGSHRGGLGRAERHGDVSLSVSTMLSIVALIALTTARRIARAMRSYLGAHLGTREFLERRTAESEVRVAVYVLSTEYFPRSAERLLEALVANEMLTPILIFRLSALPSLDRTALTLFADMIARCKRLGTTLLLCEPPPLSCANPTSFRLGLPRDLTFPSLEAALRHAHSRARKHGRICIVEHVGAGADDDAPVQSRSLHSKVGITLGRRSTTKLASVRMRDRPQVQFVRKVQAPPPDR